MKILGKDGKPFYPRKTGTLIILRAPKGTTDFKAILPEEVPDWLKDPDTLGNMLDGLAATTEGHGYEYLAHKVETLQ